MKKLTIIFSIILLFTFSSIAQNNKTKPQNSDNQKEKSTKLPTAQEILDKYVEALGGKEAILKIKTRISKADVEISPMGIKGTLEIYMLAPDKAYSKLSLQGIGDIIEGCDGTIAWTIDPLMGNRKKEGDELLQAKSQAMMYRAVEIKNIYSKFEVKGPDKIDSNEVYVVKATLGTSTVTFYFDIKTGLLLAQDAIMATPQGKTTVKTIISDWRNLDGVKTPFQIKEIYPQFQVLLKFTSIETNKEIDPKLFEAPEWARK